MRRVTILVVLLFLATTATAADKLIHKTAALDANGTLSIDSHNGSVTVTTWNRPSVDIQARVIDEPFVSDEDIKATDIRVDGSGGSVRIETDYSAFGSWNFMPWSGNRPPVEYTISMPAGAALRITTHNASTRVTGLRNDVDIETHNGSIDVADLDGAAKLETHNGSVRVAFNRFARNSRISSHNGPVEVRLPGGSRFHVDADSHHLRFDSDFDASTRSSDRDRFIGDVNGGGPELRLTTHNGSVRLRKS
jgi:putative adhesin